MEPPKTTYNHLQPPTTTYNHLQPPKTTYNHLKNFNNHIKNITAPRKLSKTI